MPLSAKVEPFYAEFGARVARRRFAQRLSQADVGRPLGLTRASIANIENGRQRVLAHQLPLLAATLKCTVAQLFGEKDLPTDTAADITQEELTEMLVEQGGFSQDDSKKLALAVLQGFPKDTPMLNS